MRKLFLFTGIAMAVQVTTFNTSAFAQSGYFYAAGTDSDGDFPAAEDKAQMTANQLCSPNTAHRVFGWDEKMQGYGRAYASAIFTCDNNIPVLCPPNDGQSDYHCP